MKNRNHIVLGALLREIGKFVQRAQELKHSNKYSKSPDASKWIAELLTPQEARFTALLGKTDLDDNFLKLATTPQTPQTPLQRLVAHATDIACALHRDQQQQPEEQDYFRLRSIFHRLRLGATPSPPASLNEIDRNQRYKEHFYKLEPLRFEKGITHVSDTLFPFFDLKPASQEEYARLFEEFKKEWLELLKDPDSTASIQTFLPRFLNLLERYTWCIPAYSGDYADVPLYDLSITTAACAQALYFYHSDAKAFPNEYDSAQLQHPKFLLISGTLTGIGKYLSQFAINFEELPTPLLRARSFYLQQISEIAAMKLLEALQLLPVAKIINAGGRFLIIAPNTQTVQDAFTQVRRSINTWMYENFFGDLTLTLTAIPASAIELSDKLATTLERLQDAMEEAKIQPLADIGIQQNWQMTDYQWQQLQQHGMCTLTGTFPATQFRGDGNSQDNVWGPGKISDTCHTQLEMGRGLLTDPGFAYTIRQDGLHCNFFASHTLQFVSHAKGNGVVSWLSETRSDRKRVVAKDGIRRFLANHVPKHEEGRLLTFTELAQRGVKRDNGHGLPRLAVLNADVDNVGLLMGKSLNTPQQPLSLARLAAFSRILDLFFAGALPELLREEFPDTYTVYAGGDDLLLIGPWRDLITLSGRINEVFRHWICKNPHLSLSAGIALIKPKHPPQRAFQRVQEALEKSKQYRDDDGLLRKNALTVFGTTVDWRELAGILSKPGPAEQLNGFLRDVHSPLTTTFVHRLLVYQQLWQSMWDTGNVRGGAWKSKLCYDVSRNLSYKFRNKQELRKEGYFVLERLMTDRKMKTVRIPLFHALYRNRIFKDIE